MKEFSEDEKTIARNIDKRYKWMARDKDGILCVYPTIPVKEEDATGWSTGFYDVCRVDFLLSRELFKPIKWEDDEPTRIRDIYDPQILNDTEREYLTAVLEPLPKVRNIYKVKDPSVIKEFLMVTFYNGETMPFPYFKPRTMYKGMEIAKKYTPEELELKL